MSDSANEVQNYYDAKVQNEWNRIANRPEFLLTCRMLNRYIKPKDSVLDIGGGPGRYSLYLAEKGCDVTLFDLSGENIKFAAEQAETRGLQIKTITGDAREADKLTRGQFSHVLLMGPMYHLLDETDRFTAVHSAINLLKPGGILYVSFINLFSIIIYYMKQAPEKVVDDIEAVFIEHVVNKLTYAGDAFTKVVFTEQGGILPFMAQFPLEKLHLFGQEGIASPCEWNIMRQSKEVVDAWLDLCEKLWEREDLLSWSEHIMYVGRKV
jgi:2-polyprenyl-3-methyl-5-hydroxy-6-metoxy-1,4-benzoquinol methylase